MSDEETRFRDVGYVLLRQAVSSGVVRGLRTQILDELERQAIWAGGRKLSRRLDGVPPFQQVTRLGQAIQLPALGDAITPPPVVAAMRALAGEPLVPEARAQLLLSLPQQGRWTLDGLNWHRDVSLRPSGQSAGVQVFVLIDDVAPQGGATLALAGSHRLARHGAIVPGSGGAMTVDGQQLPVLEMTGKAGDAYLMDLRLIHTPSINATKRVRMMATRRYFTSAERT